MLAQWRATGYGAPEWLWPKIEANKVACACRLELFTELDDGLYHQRGAGVRVDRIACTGTPRCGLLYREVAIPRCYECIGQWAMFYDYLGPSYEWRWCQVVDFDEDAPAFFINTGSRVIAVLPNCLHLPFFNP